MHASEGNTTPRLTVDQLAVMYAGFTSHPRRYGRKIAIWEICSRGDHPFNPGHTTIIRWCKRWTANGGHFCYGDLPRVSSGNTRLSPLGKKAVVKRALGSNYRQTARDFTFNGKNRKQIIVERRVVKRLTDKAGYVLSYPKTKKIRCWTDHHLRGRTVFTGIAAGKGDRFCLGFVYSDEMAWPVTFGYNSKNDVILVRKGQQRFTNIQRRTKGDGAQAFSSFIMIDQYGIICSLLFTERFTIPFYHSLLENTVKPALKKRREERKHFSVAIHDHVTNSSELFEEKKMNDCFGVSKWVQHSTPLCREQDGFIDVAEVLGKRRAHKRKNMVPCVVCECKMTELRYPSASPDLNFAENVQGNLKRIVGEKIRKKNVAWRGSVAKKMKIVQDTINELDADKEYFRLLFGSVRKTYNWVHTHNGQLYSK